MRVSVFILVVVAFATIAIASPIPADSDIPPAVKTDEAKNAKSIETEVKKEVKPDISPAQSNTVSEPVLETTPEVSRPAVRTTTTTTTPAAPTTITPTTTTPRTTTPTTTTPTTTTPRTTTPTTTTPRTTTPRTTTPSTTTPTSTTPATTTRTTTPTTATATATAKTESLKAEGVPAFVAKVVEEPKVEEKSSPNPVLDSSQNVKEEESSAADEARKGAPAAAQSRASAGRALTPETRRSGRKYNEVQIVQLESELHQDGKYKYNFETDDGSVANQEGELKGVDEKHMGESVKGGFSYKDEEGKTYSVQYTADERGYIPVGDHLPVPPPIPDQIARALAWAATAKPWAEPSSKKSLKTKEAKSVADEPTETKPEGTFEIRVADGTPSSVSTASE